MSYTNQQIARQVAEILKKNKKLYFQKGTTSSAGVNKELSVRLTNGEVVRALGWNVTTPGEVTVFWDATNKRYVAWKEETSSLKRTTILANRKTRPDSKYLWKYFIKVLQPSSIEGFDADVALNLTGYTSVGITNTGSGYFAVLKKDDNYLFVTQNSIGVYPIQSGVLIWKGGSFLRTYSQETTLLNSTQTGLHNLIYCGWDWHSVNTGTLSNYNTILGYRYIPPFVDLPNNIPFYGLFDTYRDFDIITQNNRLVPELYTDYIGMPSFVSIFATSTNGNYVNVYGSNTPGDTIPSGSYTGSVSFTITEGFNTYEISNTYSATHETFDTTPYGTGDVTYSQTLRNTHTKDINEDVTYKVLRVDEVINVTGYRKVMSNIIETNIAGGTGTSTGISGQVNPRGYEFMQTLNVTLAGQVLSERFYQIPVITKGITVYLEYLEKEESTITKNGQNIYDRVFLENLSSNQTNITNGYGERQWIVTKQIPSIIIESDECCMIAMSSFESTKTVRLEADGGSYTPLTTTYDVLQTYDGVKRVDIISGNNTYSIPNSNKSLYVYSQTITNSIDIGDIITINRFDNIQIGIDKNHWKNKTYVTESKRSRTTLSGAGNLNFSSIIKNSCDLLDIENSPVIVWVSRNGIISTYRGIINLNVTQNTQSLYSVNYTIYTINSINIEVTSVINEDDLNLAYYVPLTSSNYVVITSADDYTAALLILIPNIIRQSNFYVVTDNQGNETVELAIAEIPTTTTPNTLRADIYRFNTTSLKWERRPNAVTPVSPLTDTSYFVSYHPTPSNSRKKKKKPLRS